MEFGALMMEPLTSATQWRDRVRRVEDAGLAVLHVSDHFARSPVSPLLALAAAAQVTGRIRLGTLVLNNDFRHPAVLAKEVASLQVLCDGRLDVGLGAGWMDADYAVSGIPREQASGRVDRLTGTVELLGEMFATGGPVTRTAPGYAVCELRDVPHPATAPRLLVGGGGRRVLTLAGRAADVVSINFDNREGRLGPHAMATASRRPPTRRSAGCGRRPGGARPCCT